MLKVIKNKACAPIAFFVAACIFIGTLFAATVRADESERDFPTIYCNDEVWYKSDIYPIGRYYESYYMPVSVLATFEGISISENERFGTLLIAYSVSGEASFISFNLNTDRAVTDKLEEFYALIYTSDGEYYVPAREVCDALGLSLEFYKYEKTGSMALRICNGNQKKTFSELIEMYGYNEESDTTSGGDPYITDPPITEPPTPEDAKTLYITLDNVGASVLDGVLAELKERGRKATFFAGYEELKNDPLYAVKIVAEGHSIGFSFDLDGYVADPVNSFENQNAILMRVLKCQSRFVRLHGDTEFDKYKKIVRDAEYTVWGWDVDLSANNSEEIKENLALLERELERSDVLVLRFFGNEHCTAMLSEALGYIEQNVNFTAKTINDATKAVD